MEASKIILMVTSALSLSNSYLSCTRSSHTGESVSQYHYDTNTQEPAMVVYLANEKTSCVRYKKLELGASLLIRGFHVIRL